MVESETLLTPHLFAKMLPDSCVVALTRPWDAEADSLSGGRGRRYNNNAARCFKHNRYLLEHPNCDSVCMETSHRPISYNIIDISQTIPAIHAIGGANSVAKIHHQLNAVRPVSCSTINKTVVQKLLWNKLLVVSLIYRPSHLASASENGVLGPYFSRSI